MISARWASAGLVLRLIGPLDDGAAQTLEARPEQRSARVGDLVILRLTARLPPGMELIDQVPRPLVPPPRGIRFVSADTLKRGHGDALHGTARVAFYRLGPQPVPTLALLYRRAPGEPPDTLVHMPVSVEVAALLPAGNPPLKDIKPIRAPAGWVWTPLAAVLALITAAAWWLRRRLGGSAARRLESSPPVGPFDLALARLNEIEHTARSSGNGVVPLYAGVAGIVRDCLRQATAIPHAGLTTPEVRGALPPPFADGDLGALCEAVLGDADLVKFARVRPDLATALGQVARARTLLEAWRAAEPSSRRTAE